MIVETVLETYVLFNYGEIGIVMLELAVFMFFNTLNNSRCSWFAFLIPIHFVVKDCVMNVVKQIYNQYFLFCRQKHSFSWKHFSNEHDSQWYSISCSNKQTNFYIITWHYYLHQWKFDWYAQCTQAVNGWQCSCKHITPIYVIPVLIAQHYATTYLPCRLVSLTYYLSAVWLLHTAIPQITHWLQWLPYIHPKIAIFCGRGMCILQLHLQCTSLDLPITIRNAIQSAQPIFHNSMYKPTKNLKITIPTLLANAVLWLLIPI